MFHVDNAKQFRRAHVPHRRNHHGNHARHEAVAKAPLITLLTPTDRLQSTLSDRRIFLLVHDGAFTALWLVHEPVPLGDRYGL